MPTCISPFVYSDSQLVEQSDVERERMESIETVTAVLDRVEQRCTAVHHPDEPLNRYSIKVSSYQIQWKWVWIKWTVTVFTARTKSHNNSNSAPNKEWSILTLSRIDSEVPRRNMFMTLFCVLLLLCTVVKVHCLVHDSSRRRVTTKRWSL